MYGERSLNSIQYGNIAYHVWKGEEYQPFFTLDSNMMSCINNNRAKLGMISFQYHQRYVRMVYQKSILKLLFTSIFNKPKFLYKPHWSYQWGSSKEQERRLQSNFYKINKCE